MAVMPLHAVPADIRKMGGVARMADPTIIEDIINSITIPVMAKVGIEHFVEAQILEALEVDMVDESEVLTPADQFHIEKIKFTIPFVCGARNLGKTLHRIKEGAAMIRTKGEAKTGDVSQVVLHMRMILGRIRSLQGMDDLQLLKVAREVEADYDLVVEGTRLQRLPVVNFAAGGVATPADAALMMQLGADGVFVDSGTFKGLGAAMKSLDVTTISEAEALQTRGW